MVLNEKVSAKLEEAFADDDTSYAIGYKDALWSFALALQEVIPEGLLIDAMEAAMDAYVNNDEFHDENDGQPTEMQEWHDYDPDC